MASSVAAATHGWVQGLRGATIRASRRWPSDDRPAGLRLSVDCATSVVNGRGLLNRVLAPSYLTEAAAG